MNNASDSAPVTRPEPHALSSRLITADSAGPVRLGMTPEEVRQPELEVNREERQLEGMPAPTLVVGHQGTDLLLAELQNERVWRIRVVSDTLATPEDARVGDTARRLGELYGRGTVATGEGNVCALFAKAPGRSFCFEFPAGKTGGTDSWEELVGSGAVVEEILVVGAGPR